MFDIVDFCLDFIFPKLCVGCGSMGSFICSKCMKTIVLYTSPITLSLPHNALDSATAMAEYEGVIKPAIAALKYKSIKDIGKVLGSMMVKTTCFPVFDVITAVPLHPCRQNDRGFNQAEVIAKAIAGYTKKPYYPLLKRIKKTTSQVIAGTREARLSQLENAFDLSPFTQQHLNAFKGASVLLIDDVITTGATLNECAIVLKQSGFSRVDALAVAHGQA